MKMQKFVTFVKKNLKLNKWKIQKYLKVRDHCHDTGEYRGAAYSTCNLKYNIPKKTPITFNSGSNSDSHFIIQKVNKRIWNSLMFTKKHWKT